MPKRFTEADKWRDKWFRGLPPGFKLAWLYVLDNCDAAGVLEVDEELANFQIGIALDWSGFLEASKGRIEDLGTGKVWVRRFIEYQYGELSKECRAHNPAFASLEKHGLKERVSKGYPKGIQRVQDKDKDKIKDKDKDKEGDARGSWILPPEFDDPEVRCLLDEFDAMRSRERKPIKDLAATSKVFRHFDDRDHLVYALETCIANRYQGLKPDYRKPKPNGFVVGEKKSIKDLIIQPGE